MDDAAGSSMLEQADDRARHTLTVHAVALLLAEAGVPRSERRIKHFCQIGTLTAKKFPTPTGPQWFVDPQSVPGVIGDLKQFDEQIRSRLQHAAADFDTPKEPLNTNSAAAGSSMLEHAAADLENKGQSEADGGVMQPAAAGSGMVPADLNIFEHPYVKKLEDRVEKLEAKYEAQVRRTEEIQLKGQAQLLELQRMTAVGQSQTLADFMLKAKDWIIGQGSDVEKREADGASVS